jgi:hypothetical protein
MKEFENAHAIKNPFKFYRYESIGAYRTFSFETDALLTRPSLNEDGYDDITDIVPLESKGEIIQNRMAPILGDIDEDFFIQNSDHMYLGDCLSTQEWGESDRLRLLNMIKGQPKIAKVSREEFESKVLKQYIVNNKRSASIDDIVSMTVEYFYFSNLSENKIKVLISNIKFAENIDVKDNEEFVRSEDAIMLIDSSVLTYYYDIEEDNAQSVMVALFEEYILTPVMIFESDLYREIKYKIDKVRYESGGAIF